MPVTRNQSNAAASAKANTVVADSSGARENSERGETSAETEPPRRDSPENCSICLGPFNNKSFTSSCAHSFCFVCLKQWSKVKAECPLCKQPFTSIFHNIRSNDSYDIYELPPLNPPRQMDYTYLYNYMGGSLTTFAPTHHYLSLPQPSLDADLTLSNFSRFQFRHRRYDRYLNPLHPVHGEHQYSYSSSSFNPSTHVSAASWPRGAQDFRHRVYRHHMGPPTVILGCENSTYRLTPAMVAASAHRMQRIMPWLTRELMVLLRTHQSVRLAISVIQPLLSQVAIDSDYFNDRVSPLIGQRSRQFIQEFVAFTNSALNMQTYDRKAMYRRRLARFLDETTSSSSSDDDDVVEVTDVSPEVQVSSVISPPSNTSVTLQRSGWYSPTPGPSWETMDTHIGGHQMESDRVSISSESDDPVFRPDLNDSDSNDSKTGSDIVFVKFDKPWNERSPIQLSSDSDGERRSRKRKKVKHKKKRKEISDIQTGAKKGKGHKSSKSKSKEKVRPSKGSSEDEFLANITHNRSHSAVSLEKQKRKKHRRSKDKNDDHEGHNRDRELVDRLFAEAITQQQNLHMVSENGDASIPCSSKSKDKSTGKSNDKDRHKRKKKKKNQSRGSSSPAILPSYKKHHSGHKKSLDKVNHESERKRHQHRRTSRENGPEYSGGAASLDRELHAPRKKSLPPSSVDHSMASTFQTSYLTRTDTVQHIPLNLWVSTWPSLPVSHTFPAPPTSTFPPSSLSQPLASSSLSSHNLNHSLSENNSSAMNSQTISSDSDSSSSDSDTDDSEGTQISPVPNRARTKQWLDANFPNLGRQPTSSSTQQTTSTLPSSTRIWGIDSITETHNVSSGPSEDIADVVSIGSGDEDIVVCSSASSTKSDSDEVKVIESYDACDVVATSVSNIENFSVHKQTLQGNSGPHSFILSLEKEDTANLGSLSDQNMSSPSCSSFQPFKLHKKSATTVQNVNPFFSSLTHSSDDDGTGDADTSAKQQTTVQDNTNSVNELSNSIQLGVRSMSSDQEFKSVIMPSSTLGSSASPHGNTFPTSSSLFESSLKMTSENIIPTSYGSNNHYKGPGDKNISPSLFSLPSSTSEPVFGVLPPLPAPTTAPVSSILSSTLNYLPYPPLSMSTPLSSILPQSLPFVVPQAPAPPSLPLPFAFPPIQPLMPGSSTIFPTVYVSYSQTAQVATTASSNAFMSSRDSKPSFPSLTSDSKFAAEAETGKMESSTQVVADDFEAKSSEITSTTSVSLQSSFSNMFAQDNKYENAIESSTSEETSACNTKLMPMSEKSDQEPVRSISDSHESGDAEEFPGNCQSTVDFLAEEDASNTYSSSVHYTALSIDERMVELSANPNEHSNAVTNSSEKVNIPSEREAPQPVFVSATNSNITDVFQ